jgi:hypothetical protein
MLPALRSLTSCATWPVVIHAHCVGPVEIRRWLCDVSDCALLEHGSRQGSPESVLRLFSGSLSTEADCVTPMSATTTVANTAAREEGAMVDSEGVDGAVGLCLRVHHECVL